MIQRTGEVVIRMLANVQQVTIRPLIADFRGPKFTYNETIVGTGRQG
jgi:hypothetical protein